MLVNATDASKSHRSSSSRDIGEKEGEAGRGRRQRRWISRFTLPPTPTPPRTSFLAHPSQSLTHGLKQCLDPIFSCTRSSANTQTHIRQKSEMDDHDDEKVSEGFMSFEGAREMMMTRMRSGADDDDRQWFAGRERAILKSHLTTISQHQATSEDCVGDLEERHEQDC